MLSICSFANAGIVNNGSYTTVDGLDWLDWTLTQDLTQSEALAANLGWRPATLIEMESMMNTMFSTSLTYDTKGIDWNLAGVANASTLKSSFIALFGETGSNNSTFATVEGLGIVGFDALAYAGFGRTGRNTLIYSDIGYRSSWTGVAMVRSGFSVPEPSTLAIFALGMIGLASRRFKKQS